jgi:ribosomal protein L11 methyltransferase
MRRVSFRVPAGEKEELLDALMPLLPAGVREAAVQGGEVELTSIAAAPPERAALEAAAGHGLAGWHEEEVAADWRARRARFGGGAFLVAGRLLVRSPWDPPPADPALLDLVLERGGGGFGSGSHPTTRMCLELLLELEPRGGAADLGCGLGTLAIAAARLGWAPVVAVDRMDGAVAAARANGARNGAVVDWRTGDLELAPLPLAELVLVNAPPPVHARVAAALPGRATAGDAAPICEAGAARRLIVSGVVAGELAAVVEGYGAAGWVVADRREADGWAAARLEPALA